ncbi:MAG TPA: malto-oligosyltrehalose trehalohydrolase, partial [Dehalococcoidia bacterium]|nr:malto-oligosyltrehalose trehalohydrolase [Dehalococcoidia bacterium]
MDPARFPSADHQAAPGAACLGDGRGRFRVWAPLAQQVEVHIVSPGERWETLVRDESGYHAETLEGVSPDTRYWYRLDGAIERPDPASRFQPEGVHGPSQVTGPDFPWNDHHWPGVLLKDYIAYELHVGVFTSAGTFDAVIPELDDLKSLGITAVELMPVAQFPGERNWGYDGVGLFAAQNSYGG